MKVVIKRCPVCESIRQHAEESATALERDMGLETEIKDGEKGEFSVYVDDQRILQTGRDTMPSLEELKEAVGKVKLMNV